MDTQAAIPDSRALRLGIVKRLAAVWLLLALVAGGGTYFIEMGRADAAILAKAIEESRTIVEHLQHAGAVHREEVSARAAELTRNNFISVELYGTDRRRIYQAARDSALSRSRHPDLKHRFPEDDRPVYQTYWVDGAMLMQVMIPLRSEAGVPMGYLEGLYSLKPEDAGTIRMNVAASLGAVVLVILATTAVLYPIILRLNGGLLRFSEKLLDANVEMIEVLGGAIAKRDSDTSNHNYRVTYYAIRLAERLRLPCEEVCMLIVGAFLHDVGKIGISDTILLKPGRLAEDEMRVMRTHVELGLDVIGRSAWLKMGADVVGSHHERYDGTGYPSGLAGSDIPLNARIFAIVDVFDALTSARPYKLPYRFETALEMMAAERGHHFDPAVFDAFASIARDLHAEINRLGSGDLEILVRPIVRRHFRLSRVDAADALRFSPPASKSP
jgi:HD-GYP domain-containing protein (c-di-GMP phosphodiesterase class II)